MEAYIEPFASSHNQKKDNNQSKINKQPEVPENQTSRNSDNHGITETIKQSKQTDKVADGENPWQGGRLCGRGWLKGKLRLRAGCGLWRLPWWEKLPVSHESLLETGLEMSRGAALFPLWPLPHKQHHSTARRVALPRWIPKAPPPYNLTGAPNKEIWPKWKNRAKLQKES